MAAQPSQPWRPRLEQTPQWHIGDWAERQVQRWALRQGYAVLRLSAMGRDNRAVLPDGHTLAMADFGLLSESGLEGVEVKYKEAPALYQVEREFRHGVDLPLWDAYLHIQTKYAVPVLLWVVEYRPGRNAQPCPTLLRAMVDTLAPHVQRAPTPTEAAPYGMAYWGRHLMDSSHLPTQVGAPPLHLPRLEQPWERVAKDGHAPQAGDGVSEGRKLKPVPKQLGLFDEERR
jgi:hypothetical protein